MFNGSQAMVSDGRDGDAFLVKRGVALRGAVRGRRLEVIGAAVAVAAVVQAVDVLRHGALLPARDGRRVADGAGRDASDARLAGRPLALGRVVADVRRDVVPPQNRVHVAVHLHALRQSNGVHFRHDAARSRAPLRPPLVERIRPAPNSVAPPSHFRFGFFPSSVVVVVWVRAGVAQSRIKEDRVQYGFVCESVRGAPCSAGGQGSTNCGSWEQSRVFCVF